jgi:F0F1-type ATP synthase assembly protein I
MANGWRSGELSGLALLVSGAILVGATVGGYLVGSLVDRALHSEPTWMTVGTIVGFIAGIIDLYRVAMRIMAMQPAPAPLREETMSPEQVNDAQDAEDE